MPCRFTKGSKSSSRWSWQLPAWPSPARARHVRPYTRERCARSFGARIEITGEPRRFLWWRCCPSLKALINIVRVCCETTLLTPSVPYPSHFPGYIRLDEIRLYNCLVPMQCTGNSGCFQSPGKASSHSAALPSDCFPWVKVCVFLYHRLWGPVYSYTTDGSLILFTSAGLEPWHTKGGQAHTSLHKSWLGGTNKKMFLTLAQP